MSEIKLQLEFVCKNIEQAEKFASEAYHQFFTTEEYPRMILSTIYENNVPVFETRNVRVTDHQALFGPEQGMKPLEINQESKIVYCQIGTTVSSNSSKMEKKPLPFEKSFTKAKRRIFVRFNRPIRHQQTA